MHFVEHDHMVEQLAANRADEAVRHKGFARAAGADDFFDETLVRRRNSSP